MKRKLLIISLLLGVGILSSCDNFLDVKPFTSVDDKTAISNTDNAIVALTGVYDALQSEKYIGRNFVIFGDVQTDNIFVKPVNSNRFIQEASWQLLKSTGDVADYWNQSYDVINRANNIINASITGDATTVNQIVGEALALRAMAHFDLVRVFAQNYGYTADASHLGIPYVTKHDPTSLPARNTVKEVYTNIVKDLKDAESKVTTDRQAPYTISIWAVKALLSRVYLTMGDYANAKTYAEAVINASNSGKGVFSLVSNASYIASWGVEKTSESIFTLAFSNTDYNATNGLGYMFLEKGYGDMLVNPNLSALYTNDDVRKQLFIPGVSPANSTYTYCNKYPGRDGAPGLDNFNIIRLSEMYLIAAEASVRTGDDVTAQNYLDVIRKRAMPSTAKLTVTGDALIDAILLEKRKEFAFEGQYFFDLKRLKQTITGATINNTNIIVNYPDNKLAWPFPERETDVNPNIKQNPGY